MGPLFGAPTRQMEREQSYNAFKQINMQRDLTASLTQVQWFVNAYLLALSVVVISGGRLADMYGGLRRLYLLGVSLFGLASAACGFANSATTLMIAKEKIFLGTTLTFFCVQFAWIASVFIAMYFQTSLSFSPTVAGFLLLTASLPQAFLNPLAGRLADGHGCRNLIAGGFLLIVIVAAILVKIADSENFWLIYLLLFWYCLAMPFIFVPQKCVFLVFPSVGLS